MHAITDFHLPRPDNAVAAVANDGGGHGEARADGDFPALLAVAAAPVETRPVCTGQPGTAVPAGDAEYVSRGRIVPPGGMLRPPALQPARADGPPTAQAMGCPVDRQHGPLPGVRLPAGLPEPPSGARVSDRAAERAVAAGTGTDAAPAVERLPLESAPPSLMSRGTAAASTGLTVPAEIASAEFERMLGQRLLTMIRHGAGSATIRLQPEHLGTLDLHLKLDKDAVHLSVHSPHALVREALEQAVPRLRELFADAGLELLQFDVGSHERRREELHSQGSPPRREPSGEEDLAATATGGTTAASVRHSIRLVDAFA